MYYITQCRHFCYRTGASRDTTEISAVIGYLEETSVAAVESEITSDIILAEFSNYVLDSLQVLPFEDDVTDENVQPDVTEAAPTDEPEPGKSVHIK